MNIFVLDRDTRRCARYHCDQHVIKMILESTQMLCTALSKWGFTTPYRPTHTRHPCVLWVEESFDNFIWLRRLAIELNREFRYRFSRDRDHRSVEVIRALEGLEYERVGLTPFAQAMPEKYRVPDNAVEAYRAFYLGEKMGFAKWTRRKRPYWIEKALRESDDGPDAH